MSLDSNFTVTSWFLGNVRVNANFNTQWGGTPLQVLEDQKTLYHALPTLLIPPPDFQTFQWPWNAWARATGCEQVSAETCNPWWKDDLFYVQYIFLCMFLLLLERLVWRLWHWSWKLFYVLWFLWTYNMLFDAIRFFKSLLSRFILFTHFCIILQSCFNDQSNKLNALFLLLWFKNCIPKLGLVFRQGTNKWPASSACL